MNPSGKMRYYPGSPYVADKVSRDIDRLRLIFFGNFHQDWTEFVLSDLGIYQYEQVAFSPAARGFRTRRDIDDFLALHQCRERFEAGEDPAAIIADLPACAEDNEWPPARRKLANTRQPPSPRSACSAL